MIADCSDNHSHLRPRDDAVKSLKPTQHVTFPLHSLPASTNTRLHQAFEAGAFVAFGEGFFAVLVEDALKTHHGGSYTETGDLPGERK